MWLHIWQGWSLRFFGEEGMIDGVRVGGWLNWRFECMLGSRSWLRETFLNDYWKMGQERTKILKLLGAVQPSHLFSIGASKLISFAKESFKSNSFCDKNFKFFAPSNNDPKPNQFNLCQLFPSPNQYPKNYLSVQKKKKLLNPSSQTPKQQTKNQSQIGSEANKTQNERKNRRE